MATGERTVRELVNDYIQGAIKLPEMQRAYVWRSTQVRDLMDSLYREYPSGTILTWAMPEDSYLRKAAIEQKGTRSTVELLLDGQQRLTSLSLLMQGKEVDVRDRKNPIDILFNLNHKIDIFVEEDSDEDDDVEIDENLKPSKEAQEEDRIFQVSQQKFSKQKHWVSVIQIFKDDSESKTLRSIGYNSDDDLWDDYCDKISKVRKIRDYLYHVVQLAEAMPYEEVTDIFVRVNSLGTKLRGSDLALAQITATWPNSLSEFEKYQEKCRKSGLSFDLSIFIRMMVIIAKANSGVGDLVKFKNSSALSRESLEQAWKDVKESFDYSVNFLREHMKFESTVVLSSPFIAVVLAYFVYKKKSQIDQLEIEALKEWIKRCSMKARYSRGSSETILGQDITALQNGKSIADLIGNIKIQVGKLDVDAEDIVALNAKSPVFKTMYLAFRENGAADWATNMPISISSQGKKHKIQEHHIFPKAVLSKSENGYTDALINNIANLTFISASNNQSISSTAPEEYLENVPEDQLVKHCIPTDKKLWKVGQYENFLSARRELIVDCINAYMERKNP